MDIEGYEFSHDRWTFRASWKIAPIASNRQHLSPPLILLCTEQLHIILVKKKKKKKKKPSFRARDYSRNSRTVVEFYIYRLSYFVCVKFNDFWPKIKQLYDQHHRGRIVPTIRSCTRPDKSKVSRHLARPIRLPVQKFPLSLSNSLPNISSHILHPSFIEEKKRERYPINFPSQSHRPIILDAQVLVHDAIRDPISPLPAKVCLIQQRWLTWFTRNSLEHSPSSSRKIYIAESSTTLSSSLSTLIIIARNTGHNGERIRDRI